MFAILLLALACPRPDPGKGRESSIDTVEDSTPTDTASTGADSESGAPDTGTGDSGPDTPPCDTGTPWYADRDGDGYGDASSLTTCDDPAAVSDATDCDDGHASVYPGAPERATSGRDDDCDGLGSEANSGATTWWMVEHNPDGYYWGFPQDVALPGDIDGDGLPDAVIATWSYNDGTGGWPGAALVFRGPIPPTEYPDVSLADEADCFLFGQEFEGMYHVSGAGDVDRDGFADLLVGSEDAVIYLIRGPVPTGTHQLADVAQAWIETEFDSMLREGIGLGDLDSDGYDDVLLADQNHDPGGAVYVFRGPATETDLDAADTILSGATDSGLGSSMASLGDLDGDGGADFGLAAPYTICESYLVLDHAQGTFQPGDVGVTVLGEKVSRMVINEVGDVNGDGYGDVGFTEYSSNLDILLGPLGDAPTIVLSTEYELKFESYHGTLVDSAPLGDWDGDGSDDLAVIDNAYLREDHRDDPDCWEGGFNWCTCGAVFLVAGPVSAGIHDLEEQPDHLLSPFLNALAGGEDVTGDGFPDLALAWEGVGAAFVLFGGGTE